MQAATRRAWHAAGAAALIVAGANADRAFADTASYPTRPIEMIIPAEPGGGMDILGRIVAKQLGGILGQSVIVQNKPGAAGMIATEAGARAEPDGYTILEANIGTLALNPSLYKKRIRYDAVRDFAPITKAVVVSNVLVVTPSLPARNAQEFLALAKARPGQLNDGVSGIGSGGHMAGELFAHMTGTNLVTVPYKGGGAAVADVAKGAIQLSFATVPSTLPLIQAGRLRALAVTTKDRVSSLPDVPTLGEALLPGYEASNWYCYVAPAGTPKAVVDKLNAALHQALQSPEVVAQLRAQGMEPDTGTPEQLGAFIKSEIDRWAEVVRDQHVTAE